MTVIVAVVSDDGEIIFGADSAATDTAGTLALRGDAKVFKRDGYTIGFCGSYRVGQLVKHEMRLPAIDHEMTAAQVVTASTQLDRDLRNLFEKCADFYINCK